MKKTLVIASTLATLTTGAMTATSAARAEAPTCHRDAAKLTWFMCAVKPVDYKRGLTTETRDECAVNEPIPAAGGCDLGDLARRVPADVDPSNVFFYAIGPLDFDFDAGFEAQRQQDKEVCAFNVGRPDSWQLMKFSEAFDKSNAERSQLVDDRLAAEGKKIVGGVMVSRWPDTPCKGKRAVHAALDRATLSSALWYAESVFAK